MKMPFSQFVTLQRGFDLTKGDIREGYFPVVGSTSILGYHDTYKVEPPGVVIGRSGSLGTVQFITEKYWPHNTSLWVKDFKGNDPRFVFYCFRGIDFSRFNAGAGVPTLNRNHLDTLEVEVASLPAQRRIVEVLSAYDDLIENTRRRVHILEAMARLIYREWFVQFRFPGHEGCQLVDSRLGEIPQGWAITKLFDVARVAYGKNLPTKNLDQSGRYPVYGAAKIIGWYDEFTFEHRTIICGCRGSVGEIQITQPKCFVTNNSFTFDPIQSASYFWLFHTLKERGLRDVIGGAAQPQITLDGISSVELVTPPLPLRKRFQQIVTSMFDQAWTLDEQIRNLRRTRDLLLPRLMSGQLDFDVA